jgi:hypothetical protein
VHGAVVVQCEDDAAGGDVASGERRRVEEIQSS